MSIDWKKPIECDLGILATDGNVNNDDYAYNSVYLNDESSALIHYCVDENSGRPININLPNNLFTVRNVKTVEDKTRQAIAAFLSSPLANSTGYGEISKQLSSNLKCLGLLAEDK